MISKPGTNTGSLFSCLLVICFTLATCDPFPAGDPDPVANKCKVLIDASRDGGGWWFPQSQLDGFSSINYHQGQQLANALATAGYSVHELPRGAVLDDSILADYFIIIRAGASENYTASELAAYKKVIEQGTNLILFSDQKKNGLTDDLEKYLGLYFWGDAVGTITKFAKHTMTNGMTAYNYPHGAVLTPSNNTNIELLGWLSNTDYADYNYNGVQDFNEPTGMPVMGILHHPTSNIFFIADINTFEIDPYTFVNNLKTWLGTSCN